MTTSIIKWWTNNIVLMLLQINLSGNDHLRVEAGDHFGFRWMSGSVVAFDHVRAHSYCEQTHTTFGAAGTKSTLVANRHGSRQYSIKLHYACGM